MLSAPVGIYQRQGIPFDKEGPGDAGRYDYDEV